MNQCCSCLVSLILLSSLLLLVFVSSMACISPLILSSDQLKDEGCCCECWASVFGLHCKT
jgi:hypothetical protein